MAGTTPIRGWPYPESSDFVADGATAIENLADAIDDTMGRGYVLERTIYYTSNNTFTKATYPWLRAIRCQVVGGGGGGGGANSGGGVSCGGGGGGGAWSIQFITNIAGLAASETITVGGGGSSGAGGGTSSAFGATCTGGSGGGATANTTSRSTTGTPAGGTASGTYQLAINGQRGQSATAFLVSGSHPYFRYAGDGGSSYLGQGGAGGADTRVPFNQSGIGATGKGAGGGGATLANSGFGASGGSGAPGIVIVELFA